jgi:hypothetical protein
MPPFPGAPRDRTDSIEAGNAQDRMGRLERDVNGIKETVRQIESQMQRLVELTEKALTAQSSLR